MIVLHGLLGSSRNWLSTGRDLAKHFHVFALDARNHGKSPHDAEMSYEVMMTDIIAWMDGQGLAKAVIVGHSMGGLVAIAACEHATATGMNWPQATRMLICLGAPQLGAPLERLGHLVTSALQMSTVTLPLGRIAAARGPRLEERLRPRHEGRRHRPGDKGWRAFRQQPYRP